MSGLFPACCALLLAMVGLAGHAPAQTTRRHYDIAALPLDLALSRYSQVSGVDVLLREPAVDQRHSAPIRGDFEPAEALSRLLEGSGLVARFTSPQSAVIVPAERANHVWTAPSVRPGAARPLLNLEMMRVTAPRMIGRPSMDRAQEDAFVRRLALGIRRLVMDQAGMPGGTAADLRIATRITPEGTLQHVRILRGSRDRALDARVAALLEGARLGLTPPQGLRQPLLFDVSGR